MTFSSQMTLHAPEIPAKKPCLAMDTTWLTFEAADLLFMVIHSQIENNLFSF